MSVWTTFETSHSPAVERRGNSEESNANNDRFQQVRVVQQDGF